MADNTNPTKESAVKSPFGGGGIVILECGVMCKHSRSGKSLDLITKRIPNAPTSEIHIEITRLST